MSTPLKQKVVKISHQHTDNTMFKKIDHIALHVKDLDVSKIFYTRNFGFTEGYYNVVNDNLRIIYLELGGTTLELSENYEGKIIGSHFCLHTSNFEADIQQLITNNIKLLTPPHPTKARTKYEEGWKRAVFLGPDQEQIEIRG